MGILFCLIFFPIALICAFGVPVLMGVLVYRDAAKRDTNPWLWALVAALVPSFIGLLIYLLVRNDYAVLEPGQQQASRSSQGNAQSAWSNGVGDNASAGADGPQGTYDSDTYEYRTYTNAEGETFTQQVPKKKPGLPTWAKVLIIIGIILVIVALVALIIGVAKYIFGYGVVTYHNGFPL